MELSSDQKFQALTLRYQDQVELHRMLTNNVWKIFVAYSSFQMVLGAWLVSSEVLYDVSSSYSLLVIDFSITLIAYKILGHQHERRQEVTRTIQNLNEAFEFNVEGVYLPGKALNPEYHRRYWLKRYRYALAAMFVAIFAMVLYGTN
mgnify:CR=1 FL=1